MALGEESSGIPATMLVGPASVGNAGMSYPVYYPQGNGNSGNGFGDNSGWWIILLFLLLVGNNGWGNANGGYGAGAPIIVSDGANGGSVQRGFDQAAVMGGINGVTAGISGIQQSLCNGFAGVNATINSTAANAETAANARAMANMQQMFGLQSQFADCCCENRLGLADLKYTVATENCADRTQSLMNTRDIIDSQTRGTQAILDKLCALELDGVKGQLAQAQRENVGLQNQLNMATLRESQTAQNAFIQQGLSNEVDALYNRLSNCPVPSVPVYGRQPIFTCGNNGCGCGA